MGKSLPLLIGKRKKCLQHFRVMHWTLVSKDSPIANGNEKGHLQHLEAYTGVWFSKTPLLLMQIRKDVSNIWSHALVIHW